MPTQTWLEQLLTVFFGSVIVDLINDIIIIDYNYND